MNQRQKSKPPILWADDALLVVNKPAGLLSLPDGYDPDAPYLGGVLEATYGRLWVVHRLDRDTSGVIVLARTAEAHQKLNTQFESRNVSKVYHALIVGSPAWDERTVNFSLRADGDRKHRTVVDAQAGKPAVTHVRVLERLGQYTLVEARPQTGRTHQIRVHLFVMGLPIVADALYGAGQAILLSELKPGYRSKEDRPERPLLGRVGLHAWSLALEHPLTGQPLEFEAAYPKDFGATLRQLRRWC